MEASAQYEKYSFVTDLTGEEIEGLQHDLETLAEKESPLNIIEEVWDDKVIRERFKDGIEKIGAADASILLGRLTSLFGNVALEEKEVEGMGFRAPFVVYPAGHGEDPIAVAMAFDEYASARFVVVPLLPDEGLALDIAREFWSIILSDLDNLEDESARVFNEIDSVWLHYGVINGVPFYQEEEPEEDELEDYEDEPYGQDSYGDDNDDY